MSEDVPDLRASEERREDGTFAPGKSPNPGGQAQWLKPIREGLRAGSAEAVIRLRKIVAEGSDKDANVAAKVLLDYAVPKPKQTVRMEGDKDVLAVVTSDDLVAFIKNGGGK